MTGKRWLAGLGLLLAAGWAGSGLAQNPAPVRTGTGVARLAIRPPETTVSSVTVTAAPVPKVGKGAPMFTASELAEAQTKINSEVSKANFDARQCGPRSQFAELYNQQALYAQRASGAAKKAEEATAAALQARVAASGGDPALQKASEEAELARQAAVNAFLKARTDMGEAKAQVADVMEIVRDNTTEVTPGIVQGLVSASAVAERRDARIAVGGVEGVVVDKDYLDLDLLNIKLEPMSDRRGAYLHVTGYIGNPRPQPVVLPAVGLVATDAMGFNLSSATMVAPRKTVIPSKKMVEFNYDFRPVPTRTANVLITFVKVQKGVQLPLNYFCSPGGSRAGRSGLPR